MLSEIAEFLYTTVLKPRPLRKLVNKIILLLLPQQVKFGTVTVRLNPLDPVVSGALMLGVYERKETLFVNTNLKKGDLFIDVGANVGYYTAIAMHLVGPDGMVIALEPDPVSFLYLNQTIAANIPANVKAYNLAATDGEGDRDLYVSSENRGDNRFHPFKGATDVINIHTVSVDSLIEKLNLQNHLNSVFIKIDVQGSEGLVIQGMKNVISNADTLILLMEFWPQGLENMNTDPETLLDDLEQLHLELFELRQSGKPVKINSKSELLKRLYGRKYTNIIGIKH